MVRVGVFSMIMAGYRQEVFMLARAFRLDWVMGWWSDHKLLMRRWEVRRERERVG